VSGFTPPHATERWKYLLFIPTSQFRIIQILDAVIRGDLRVLPATSIHQNFAYLLGFIPTGDGFYAVLHPGVYGYGVFFALGVQSLLLNRQQDHPDLIEGVRVAVHSGPTLPFRDVSGRLNFVGTGMNDAARLLSLQGETRKQAEIFAGSRSYAVASSTALAQFHRRYASTPQGKAFLEQYQFQQSGACESKDQHGRIQHFHSIRTDSRLVQAPPEMGSLEKGSHVDVREALERVMEELAPGLVPKSAHPED
jgi:hypothetical protein